MAKLAGAWATVQFMLALGTLMWAAIIFLYPAPDGLPTKEYPRDAFFPGVNVAAAVFFVAASILFGRSHPDARIVGIFGVGIFAITNGALIFDRATGCADGSHGCHLNGNPFSTPVQGLDISAFQGPRLDAIIATTLAITILQIALLWAATAVARRARREEEADRLQAEAAEQQA